MVNVLLCSLSPWRGDGELCRWCNAAPARGGKNYCSRECLAGYADNHYYARGRARVGDASRGPCDCPRSMSPQGAYLDEHGMVAYLEFPKPHRICASCGRCEEEVFRAGDKLSCNHINPRNGIPLHQAHCIHHMMNLEIMCWRDHSLLNQLLNQRHLLNQSLVKLGYV